MAKEPKVGSKSFFRKYAVDMAKWVAKERDDFTCQKCGKEVSGVNCQGSHVFSVGSYPSIAADPLNIKCLCYKCHLGWWHKEPLEAFGWFTEKFPDRYEYLLKQKNKQKVNMEDEYYKLQGMIKNIPPKKKSKYLYKKTCK